jgi:septal ring factor EnvC (AmiA/AmiB activator)
MTSSNDPYQFSMDDSISTTPRTRSSSRTRKATLTSTENNTKKKVSSKEAENNSNPKTAQQRITTRSSQKSPLTSNDDSFMSNISSGFSQFVNPKKRQHDEKKTKTFKRPKSTHSTHFYCVFICLF